MVERAVAGPPVGSAVASAVASAETAGIPTGAAAGAARRHTALPTLRAAPRLPVHPALSPVLPDGLRRGSTVSVSGSVSLLLALLGAPSAAGSWCALVGFPLLSAEAVAGYGVHLPRLAVVSPGGGRDTTGWLAAVGALLDAVDVVAARPAHTPAPGEIRRLAARARTHGAVLVAYGEWPGADLRLRAEAGPWEGIGTGRYAGGGRLRARRVRVTADGRGSAARPRQAELLLPGVTGDCAAPAEQVFPAPDRLRGPKPGTGGENLIERAG